MVAEEKLINVLKEMELAEELANAPMDCTDCIDKYVATIDEKIIERDSIKAMTEAMAESLAEIDPNTDNGAEGKALLRKMYKIRGMKP